MAIKRCLVVVLIFLTFGLGLQNGFIAVTDDQLNILGHHHDIARVWTEFYEGFFIPVPYTVWSFLWKLNASPFWYHLIALALHAATSLIVYEILNRYHPRAAFLAALFWSLNFFNAEVVAWASGLRDGLSGFFLFAALLSYLNKKDLPAFALGALAVLSKPGAVVLLPLALILRPSWRAFKFVPLVALATFSVSQQVAPDYTWAARIDNALGVIGFYVTGGSSADHWLRSGGMGVFGFLVLIGMYWSKGLRLYVAALFPVLGFIPFAYQFWSNVADRYAYVPLFGLAFAYAGLFEHAEKSDAKPFLYAVTGIAIYAQSMLCFAHTQMYKDVWSLYYPEIYWCPPEPAHWWLTDEKEIKEIKDRTKHFCEYRIKPTSALVLSIYLRSQGYPKLAATYEYQAKLANDQVEKWLERIGAYRSR